jgi:hypothetical protein
VVHRPLEFVLDEARGRERQRLLFAEQVLTAPGLEESEHLVRQHPAVDPGHQGIGERGRAVDRGNRVSLPQQGVTGYVPIRISSQDAVRRDLYRLREGHGKLGGPDPNLARGHLAPEGLLEARLFRRRRRTGRQARGHDKPQLDPSHTTPYRGLTRSHVGTPGSGSA